MTVSRLPLVATTTYVAEASEGCRTSPYVRSSASKEKSSLGAEEYCFAPVTTLLEWSRDGSIDEVEFRSDERLSKLSALAGDIERYMDAAHSTGLGHDIRVVLPLSRSLLSVPCRLHLHFDGRALSILIAVSDSEGFERAAQRFREMQGDLHERLKGTACEVISSIEIERIDEFML